MNVVDAHAIIRLPSKLGCNRYPERGAEKRGRRRKKKKKKRKNKKEKRNDDRSFVVNKLRQETRNEYGRFIFIKNNAHVHVIYKIKRKTRKFVAALTRKK